MQEQSALPLLALLHRESAQVRHRHPSRSNILVGEGRWRRQEHPRLLIEDPASDSYAVIVAGGLVVASFSGHGWVEEQTEQGNVRRNR